MVLMKGLLFGMTLQLAVGPVFFAVLHKSMRESMAEAFKMVLGVALTDAFYIVISFTGIGALLEIELLNRLILFGGAGILIFFGVLYFRNAGKSSCGAESMDADDSHPEKHGNSFLYGIKLTLTNPLTVVFWSGTFGAMIASKKLEGIGNILLYSSGCVSATLLFLGAACVVGKYAVKLIKNKGLKYLDYCVGGFLIFFGASMLFK